MGPKILINAITLDGISLGGANLVPLLSKIKVWQDLDCRITLLTSLPVKKKIDSLGIIDVYEFLEIKNSRFVANRLSFMMESLIRNLRSLSLLNNLKKKFDIVYSISSVLDLVFLPYCLAKVDRQVRFYTVFDNFVPFAGAGNFFIRFLAWSFYQCSNLFIKTAHGIFTVTDDLKNYLVQKGFDEDLIQVTGNGVQKDMIEQSQKDDQYRIDALFVGRICRAKGIFDALRVLDIVKQKYPDFQFAVMGNGDSSEEKQFRQKIEEMNLQGNVQFLGYRIGLEKFNIMKSSRCFWFFSESESFGQSLLEAVICGLPAFVYDLKPYRALYRNNEVYVFKQNDVESVAHKVIEVFEGQTFVNEAGKHLIKRYTWKEIAEQEYKMFVQ